jgi:putative effector of murein hydrolase
VVAAVVTIGALALFEHPVEAYLTGGIGAAGAGDLLMLLLNPAVSALGFLLFEERRMLRDHAVEIVTALVPAALLALLSAAAAAGALRLSREYALAVIPRSVTTPIAIPIAETLGANPGITAALVVITGLLGAIFGPALLDRLGFTSPVIRGVAIGASSHGIGAAALVATDPPAAAISGIAFALMATISAAAVSIVPICQALIRLAGGP